MNNQLPAAFLVGTLALALGSPVRAALIDRGGGLIYDDALNVTWLQDANYAKTSGFRTARRRADECGSTQWLGPGNSSTAAMTTGGCPKWSRSMAPPSPTATATNGSTDYAQNVSYPGRIRRSAGSCGSLSELDAERAHLHVLREPGQSRSCHDERNATKRFTGIDWGVTNTSFVDGLSGDTVSFENLQNHLYWSGTEVNTLAWALWTFTGFHDSRGSPTFLPFPSTFYSFFF